jgi:penicillin-binding protein 1A
MDKMLYMRFFYFCISIPVVISSFVLFFINKKVRHGLHLSRKNLVFCQISDHEKLLIAHLISGEDHRFYNHIGFDPIAILRAIYKRIDAGKIEGASTIEQQYVRTCTERLKWLH